MPNSGAKRVANNKLVAILVLDTVSNFLQVYLISKFCVYIYTRLHVYYGICTPQCKDADVWVCIWIFINSLIWVAIIK